MTFSILGRCPRAGQFGAAVASSEIAAGARVAYCAAEVGAVLTQHRTDPRLGPRGLALLRSGCSAQQTLDALVASAAQPQWRQIAVLDAAGGSAAFSGARTRPEMSEAGAENAVALGNRLTTARVPPAMLVGFRSDPLAPLAERLLRALEAGMAAGGASRPVHSAHLLVVGRHGFPLVDLRVDWDEAPVAALRGLWQRYAPETGAFVLQALEPDNPSAEVV